jgi:cytochrome d ubiquinol oxidase subunit II
MESSIPVLWAMLIGAAVALYVILDGFDLGVGILFPFAESDKDRDLMINSIGPFWDGNETWLVLGGGGLLVAFPRAYAVIMPGLYLPVIIMLLGLIFRGVAFEFRTVAVTSKKYWTFAFASGSAIAAFCQGLILGGLIQGIKIENGEFAGRTFDFLTPFSVLCGLGVLTGYALLGACWLVMKTEGSVAEHSRRQAKLLLLAVLVFMALVSLWTPIEFPRIRERWFSLPNILLLWPIPAITALTAYLAWRWLEAGREIPPFIAAIVLFMLGYAGLAISVFPYLVPYSLTIWDAAAVPSTQLFLLLGTLPLLPIILMYTGFVYYIFRGKLREGEGYH